MKRYKINNIFLILIILSILFIFLSLDWNDLGLKVIEKTSLENGIQKYSVEDENKHNFEIILFKNVEMDRLKEINSLNKILFNLKFIDIKNLKYYVTNEDIEISIIPENIVINEKNYNGYFPAGIKFYFVDSLYYKIKIFTGENFIQIENKFIDEKSLTDLISDVIKNPKKYLAENNLQYLSSKIDEQEKTINNLKEQLDELKILVKQNKENIDKQIDLINQYIDYLQDTALTLGNQGLFKGPTKISKEVVNAVLKLKNENSNITTKEILDNLKNQNLDASEWEVKLILLVFYDEF